MMVSRTTTDFHKHYQGTLRNTYGVNKQIIVKMSDRDQLFRKSTIIWIIMTKIVQIVHNQQLVVGFSVGKIRLIAGNYQDKQRKNDKYRHNAIATVRSNLQEKQA